MAAGRGALLLLIAVVLGIILLNKTDNTGVTTVRQTKPPAKTTKSTTTSSLPTTTTLLAHEPSSVKVLAVNGTNTSGVGTRAKEALLAARYNALAPTDANSKPVKNTVIYFAPGYDADARLIGMVLNITNPNVQPMPAVRNTIVINKPTATANADAANVIVVVGEDIAASLPTTSTTSTSTSTTVRSTTTTAKKASTTTTTTTTKKP
jgi:hypothetical protein